MFWNRLSVVLCLFVGLFGHYFVKALPNSYPPCRPRDVCIRLTECRPYMNLIKNLRRPLNPESVQFLRRQECGFDGTYPMVCCFSMEPNSNYVATLKEEYDSGWPPAKPDFTPSDLSGYNRQYEKIRKAPLVPSSTTTSTTTDPWTTRMSRRGFLINSTTAKATVDMKREKEEILRRKMEELNRAFALSNMDAFFVRRMQEDERNETNSVS